MKETQSYKFEEIDQTAESSESMEQLPGISRVIVKGSIAYAIGLGKDLNLARDIDVFFVEDGYRDDMEIRYFRNKEAAKNKLAPEEFKIIERFVDLHELESKAIQVVHTSRELIHEVELFSGEPEVVIWDPNLELHGKIIKPVTKEEKQMLERSVPKNISWMEKDLFMSQIRTAHRLHLYQYGKLFEGNVPSYLVPRTPRLAAALRLADLGERFQIPVNDLLLKEEDRKAKEGHLRIVIPSGEAVQLLDQKEELHVPATEQHDFSEEDDKEEEGFFEKENQEMYGERRGVRLRPSFQEGVFDLPFYRAATQKELLGLMKERYPNLAEVVEEVKMAGGIREFVEKKYGEAYLARGFIYLGDPRLRDTSLSIAEQIHLLQAWDFTSKQNKDLFNQSLSKFFSQYIKVNEKTSLQEKDPRAAAEFVFQAALEDSLGSMEKNDPQTRISIYEAFFTIARGRQAKGLSEREEYQEIKQRLKEFLEKEENERLKKFLVLKFVELAITGSDLTIADDFIDIVKKEGGLIKSSRKEKKQVFSETGMLALRGLLKFTRLLGPNENIGRALSDVIGNPEIDPRLKKVCLRRLYKKGYFPSEALFINEDSYKPSKEIPWDDYVVLNRVDKIASSTVRHRLRPVAYTAACDIRYEKHGISETNERIASKLPPEFFLPLYKIFGGDKEKIVEWERLVSEIKSNKLRESILYSVSNLLQYDRPTLDLITEKIVSAEKITKEHILLADRLLKKIHFLHVLGERLSYAYSPYEKKETKIIGKVRIPELIKEAKAPSVLETQIDSMIVEGLYEITGRGDLTSDKIQTLFRAWEDPEPIFLYVAELARRYGPGNAESQGAKTLQLVGDMLAHMDPPDLTDWKQWRYRSEDSLVEEQLRGLTSEQIEAYAEDEFADLGEVLIGLLPSDKPQRIRETILHGFGHDWKEQGALENSPLKYAKNLIRAVESHGPFDWDEAVTKDLDFIDDQMFVIKSWIDLEEDHRLLERLPEQLQKWQRAEGEKRKELQKLGLRGDETREEIEERLDELRVEKAGDKEFSRLAKLKPSDLSDVVKSFLERYGLDQTAGTGDIEWVRTHIRELLDELFQSKNFQRIKSELFGDREVERRERQLKMSELKAARLILSLGNLTPQLIAFNKISPEKKRTTLTNSVYQLKEYFSEHVGVVDTLISIEKIIKEASHPVARDHLAIIFTDNPLAFLTVGRFPENAQSCQKYTSGDTVLAAYMADAYTKNCILVDLNKLPREVQEELGAADGSLEKLKVFQEHTFAFLNAIVARRLTKIVHDKDSETPQLFLENLYTGLDTAVTTRLMNAFAVTHLKPKLKMELLRGGGKKLVTVAESRNYLQYEDGETGGPHCGGLGTMSGSYDMPARPLTEAEYLITS